MASNWAAAKLSNSSTRFGILLQACLPLTTLLLLAGCASERHDEPVSASSLPNEEVEEHASSAQTSLAADHANAIVHPLDDDSIDGEIAFTRLPEGVRIVALVHGLRDGLYGFHIHEGKTCEEPGEHFNPTDSPHGDPSSASRHAGDLGNIRSSRGNARYDRIEPTLEMDGPNSIIGRAVVIHAEQDDLNSQPGGQSGEIAVCGIIDSL